MNQVIDHDDTRLRTLDAFSSTPMAQLPVATQAQSILPPVDRVHGAQNVAVRRNEGDVLRKIKELAAAAGEYFYYRYPVNNKGKKEWIEGPTIKCANAVSRLFGNCDVDCRSVDIGTHWIFHARFMDLETGYSLTRPLQQRKSQTSMRGDAGRAEDIAHQIGTSKAIRNVVTNALDTFTTFAWQEAKLSVVDAVGKQIEKYKTKVQMRLDEMNVDLHRVEHARGRPLKDWLAADVARTIAEIQAVNDGMATADETWPAKEDAAAATDTKLDGFAADGKASNGQTVDKETGEVKDTAAGQTQQDQASQSSATADTSPGAGEDATGGAADGKPGPASDEAAPPAPKTEDEYVAYANSWIDIIPNAEERKARWLREKAMRETAGVQADAAKALETKLKEKAQKPKAN